VPGWAWTAGEPSTSSIVVRSVPVGIAAFIFGTIHAGRTDEQKSQIVAELRSSVATALGCGEGELGVMTVDIPPKRNVEGGAIMPEPGQGAAWLEKHQHEHGADRRGAVSIARSSAQAASAIIFSATRSATITQPR
jgi:hypothetical protein